MDVDDIVTKQVKQMEKEMREKETKLRTQEKKVRPPTPTTHPPPLLLYVLSLLSPGGPLGAS